MMREEGTEVLLRLRRILRRQVSGAAAGHVPSGVVEAGGKPAAAVMRVPGASGHRPGASWAARRDGR